MLVLPLLVPPDSASLICLQNVIYGRSVFFTFALLTDGRTVQDIPKQHREKKYFVLGSIHSIYTGGALKIPIIFALGILKIGAITRMGS